MHYIRKEIVSFWGLGQLMGMACNRTRIQALQTSRKKAACSEIGTNSYLKYIPKVLQYPLKSK